MTDVRIISEPLGGSSLSRLLQSGQAPAGWVAPMPRGAEAWRELARQRASSADWAARLRSLLPAFNATGLAAERLARVIESGGVVVTTGQQPGLFGGPIYTWSKAASALALADAIERETGIPSAAIYWAATDDADFAEASSTVVSRPGGVQVLRALDAPEPGTPMSRAPLGDLDVALRGLLDACGTAPDRRAVQAAVAAYSDPSRTVGDAFVELMRALLAPLGMPVLDASHAAVHEASEEILAAARARAAEVETALAARAEEIRAASQMPQVEHVAGLSLVFVRENGTKRRLTTREAAGATPHGVYTPTVLLRPVVEQAILPTVAYVAGPGEIAYFAQVSAVADALGVTPPIVVPRWSCTLVEPDVDRLLERLGVHIDELSIPDAIETRLARSAMGEGSALALAQLRATIKGLPAQLGEEATPLGLDAAVQGAMRSLEHRVDRIERRLVAGIKRRESQRMREVGTLRGALYPLGGRQERALNIVPMLSRHGVELLADMRIAAGEHADRLVSTGSAAQDAPR